MLLLGQAEEVLPRVSLASNCFAEARATVDAAASSKHMNLADKGLLGKLSSSQPVLLAIHCRRACLQLAGVDP